MEAETVSQALEESEAARTKLAFDTLGNKNDIGACFEHQVQVVQETLWLASKTVSGRKKSPNTCMNQNFAFAINTAALDEFSGTLTRAGCAAQDTTGRLCLPRVKTFVS